MLWVGILEQGKLGLRLFCIDGPKAETVVRQLQEN